MEDIEVKMRDLCGRNRHPYENASFLSRLFYCWGIPLLIHNYNKKFTEDDVYKPLASHRSKYLGGQLEKAWNSQLKSRHPSLWKALLVVFGKELGGYGLIIFFHEVLIRVSRPILLGEFLKYYKPNQTEVSLNDAYLYASLLSVASLLDCLLSHFYMLKLNHLGMKMRVACCALIYRKSLRLNKNTLAEITIGQMVNLLSNDVHRFDTLTTHCNYMWIAPIEAVIVFCLLYLYYGVPALIGFVILVFFMVIQSYLGKKVSAYRLRIALKTDGRIRFMEEIISGIQVIKMFAWEMPFTKLVELARKYIPTTVEVNEIRHASYIRAINVSFILFLNRVVIFTCILVYIFFGHTLNPHYVFVVTSFYAVLRFAITMSFTRGLTAFAECDISVKRLQKFLLYEEVHNITFDPPKTSDNIIEIDNGSAGWLRETTLENVTFNARTKELVAIVGSVGSGKTSLFNVFLKELPLYEGKMRIGGTISYASQEPWLFSGSIKQNILFGQQLDQQRYSDVIKTCSLGPDLEHMQFGDRTLVGEKGVMLSGGQKARINLARALYKEADIYLLDDPLSAVDAKVGRTLFNECIKGYLKNKCVILITHQLQYLSQVDRIYLLDNGRVAAMGTYDQLKDSERFFTSAFGEQEQYMIPGKLSKWTMEDFTERKGEKESQNLGTVSGTIYREYFRSGGGFTAIFFLFFVFVLTQFSITITDYFLTVWVNLEQDKSSNSTRAQNLSFLTTYTCIYIYSSLILFIMTIAIIRSLYFFKFCMQASSALHNNMFKTVVRAPMRFFNSNPTGRILNRFAKDIGAIDEVLPTCFIDTYQNGLIVISIFCLVGGINPWILIPSAVILVFFYFYRLLFLGTSRNVKRIDSITRSPVFSHIGASLQGLTTIRALGAQESLIKEFDNHQDLNSSAFFLFISCNRIFGFWLDMNTVVYISLVTLSFLFIGKETYGGNVGLAITQSMTLTGMLQWGMRQWSDLENQMTSVERVIEYSKLETETTEGVEKPPNWPSDGNINFNSVSLQYSPEDPLVLKNLTFSIKSKEKIGIVGRTGAGKSSLISVIYRLCDFTGDIHIDSISTKSICLKDVRSGISIIPQEPILFSGTLRKNLDPFDEYPDEKLWQVLDEVKLKEYIEELPAGLHARIYEGGSNFSVGQRQLICLARAMMRFNKILILDEATANVDPQTDELIQTTIRRKFFDCTVLTIAHRLHTVVDSDKILVMDKGCAVEFDHPYVLLQNTEGYFYKLAKETGQSMLDNMLSVTQQRYTDSSSGS